MQQGAATLALATGDLSAARRWLEAYDRWLAWSGAVLGLAESQMLWAQYHRRAGDPARVREHAEAAVARATEPRQPLALLAALRLLGKAEIAAGRHDTAKLHLTASLAIAEACLAPYERALTLLALAELHIATGETDSARTLLAEVRVLCASLGATIALARLEALTARLAVPVPTGHAGGPFRLTTREVEVLRLVATGLTDAQIANRLSVSPRTIQQHLRSIYGELSVSTRTAAVHVARAHQVIP